MTKRSIMFDGDGAQYLDSGEPCSLCSVRQTTDEFLVFIRVKDKETKREIAFVCPDCVARMFLQVTRLDLWRCVSGTVLAAIRRMLQRKWGAKPKRLTEGEESAP